MTLTVELSLMKQTLFIVPKVHVPGSDRPEDEAQLGGQEEERRWSEETQRSPQGPRERAARQAEHFTRVQQKQQIC